MPSRREFLIGAGVAGAGTLGWYLDQKYHFLFPKPPGADSPCKTDIDKPDGVFEFSLGPGTALSEPSVLLVDNLLFVAANAAKLNVRGLLDDGLPMPVWVTDINSSQTTQEILTPESLQIKAKSWGSDPVMLYIPDTNQVMLVSVIVEPQPSVFRYGKFHLISSVFDIKTNTWKHQKMNLSPASDNPDKPWLYWDAVTHRGYFSFGGDKFPELFTFSTDLKFEHELTLKIPDEVSFSLPFAFPTGEGIEIIFATIDDDFTPMRAQHMLYKPDKHTVSDKKVIFTRIYPNPFLKRDLLTLEQSDKNLSAIVTPKRAICLTSGTDDQILIGYKPFDKPDWQVDELDVVDQTTGKKLKNPISINPQMVGPNVLAVTFLAQGMTNHIAYSLLLNETEKGLVPHWAPDAFAAFAGPYPCAPYPDPIELGDYSQIQAYGDKKTAFVSLLEHKLRVKIMPKLA